MPSRSLGDRLQDILTNIELARGFVADMTEQMFLADIKTVYAVTRCLEIVSEASRHLPLSFKSRHAHIPWQDIAGAGSVYRHDYEDVESRRLWQTAVAGLEPLRKVVIDELASIERTP